MLKELVHRGRHAVWDLGLMLGRILWPPSPGAFQPYYYTRADRYPWLFRFAATRLGPRPDARILSFGCSRGEEVFTLRRYFPGAIIKGIDVNPRNIARATARAKSERVSDTIFETAGTAQNEPTGVYDAIFCLAVLCNGDLTTSKAGRCDPVLYFADFERIVTDFARCLKPGGLLVLHTTNFRFGDTAVAAQFDVVFDAEPQDLAPDVIFDRDNRLMPGERERYRAVAFSKR